MGFAHALSCGAEIASFDIGYTAQTEATHSSVAGTTSTLVDLMRQSETGRVTTGFVHHSWRPLSRLIVAPAARIVHYDVASATYFEPRVTASYQVRPDFRLTGGWSMDHRLDLSTERAFSFARLGLSLGATVFNVYDQKSVIGVDWTTTVNWRRCPPGIVA